jgi:hypothetical protein
MDRRSLLKSAALAAASVPFQALRARVEGAPHSRPTAVGYGKLRQTLDGTTGLPLLLLPAHFRYVTFGWTGDLMNDGVATPGSHDGMGAFSAGPGRTRLVRNHEVTGSGTPFCGARYDPVGAGGTTTLDFDTQNGVLVSAHASLSGTIRNCAGGPTPWGTWLTCEETNAFSTVPHGYVFEVPGDGSLSNALPLRAMGRLSHEAVAVDPLSGYVYETEDAGATSGFYRFVPGTPGVLANGGQLFMLKVRNVSLADLGASYANGTTFPVEWVPIATPDNPASNAPGNAVWSQGRALGAATFARLEGCSYGNDRKIYVVSTSGGATQGQIWTYDPAAETITLLFQSPGANVLNMPDNMTVSPRGGLVLCEDGDGLEYLHGLTVNGEIFRFAQNNVKLSGERNGISGDFTASEWAGVCYSADGQWLFANIQSPGITFAITGPWGTAGL